VKLLTDAADQLDRGYHNSIGYTAEAYLRKMAAELQGNKIKNKVASE
jgi:hypothetical protein